MDNVLFGKRIKELRVSLNLAFQYMIETTRFSETQYRKVTTLEYNKENSDEQITNLLTSLMLFINGEDNDKHKSENNEEDIS